MRRYFGQTSVRRRRGVVTKHKPFGRESQGSKKGRFMPLAYKMRAFVLCLIAWRLTGAADAQGVGQRNVDDVIARILEDDPAATISRKPAAKPASIAQQPVVMSARIGEHADRTRFVVELSDPVNMRTFTLSNPNRVVIDMPAVQWHLDGPPRPTGMARSRAIATACSVRAIRAS